MCTAWHTCVTIRGAAETRPRRGRDAAAIPAQGQPGDALYIVVGGEVALTMHRPAVTASPVTASPHAARANQHATLHRGVHELGHRRGRMRTGQDDAITDLSMDMGVDMAMSSVV